MADFKSAAFNRSATPPGCADFSRGLGHIRSGGRPKPARFQELDERGAVFEPELSEVGVEPGHVAMAPRGTRVGEASDAVTVQFGVDGWGGLTLNAATTSASRKAIRLAA